jgi:hypothetical protein
MSQLGTATVAACCGRVSKKIWGDLSDDNGTQAVYFVHWTVDAPEHYPSIDLVAGRWGDGAEPVNRELVSLAFRPVSLVDALWLTEPRIAEVRALNDQT